MPVLPVRSILLAAFLCGWMGEVCATATGPITQSAAVAVDPAANSTEARWKREEIIRQGRKEWGADAFPMDQVTLVAVPILLLIGLVALVRLRDF